MSQQGFTIVSLQTGAKGRKLSDIEFLSIKEFNGKLRTNQGVLSSAGDLATLTATAGKDMYLARAKCVFYLNNDSNIIGIKNEVQLSVNAVVVERAITSYTVQTASGGSILTIQYEFKNIGLKVTAGQIIKLAVTTLDVDTDIAGFIECFEEDTGVSPQISSI